MCAKLALSEVQASPSVANILPDLAHYLQEVVSECVLCVCVCVCDVLYSPQLTDWTHYSPAQLLCILKLVLSLFRNAFLYLDLYVSVWSPPLLPSH